MIKVNVTKTGNINEYGEVTILKDNFEASTYAFPESTRATVFPGLDATHGYVAFPVIGDGSDGGPCASGAGVVVSIKDHPEVKAGYLKDPGTRDATMTATGGVGNLAALGPLDPGTYEIVATKTGCTGLPTKNDMFQFSAPITIKANTLTEHAHAAAVIVSSTGSAPPRPAAAASRAARPRSVAAAHGSA
jgi:hypothetical protein